MSLSAPSGGDLHLSAGTARRSDEIEESLRRRADELRSTIAVQGKRVAQMLAQLDADCHELSKVGEAAAALAGETPPNPIGLPTLTAEQRFILRYLRATPAPASFSQIAATINVERSTLVAALNNLVERDLLQRHGNGSQTTYIFSTCHHATVPTALHGDDDTLTARARRRPRLHRRASAVRFRDR